MNTAPVLLDFESRSRADLKAVGGRLYWAHVSTEALCCAWHDTATGETGVWFPGETWPHRGRVVVAHNAKHFDRFGGERYDFAPAAWLDSSDFARRGGLPGSLEVLGARLGYPKDTAASRFTKGLSTVRRPGKRYGDACIEPDAWKHMSRTERAARGVQAPLTVDALVRVVEYCQRDVEIVARAWPDLVEFADVDADVEAVDRIVNDRGVFFDCELARALLRCDRENASVALRDAAAFVGCSVAEVRALVRSPKDLATVLGVDDATKATLAALPQTPLVAARRAMSTIARGKLEKGLMRVSPDGRMRDGFQYYGGHTGRWSGRGMQLQNLPRPEGCFESWASDDIVAFALRVLQGEGATAAEIDLLLRACLSAPPGRTLAVCDFSGVEARATAWAAGDEDALAVFASGRDPYKVAASAIYGTPYDDVTKPERQIGKIAELALGYQGGPGAFAKMAATYGVDTSALDLDAIVAAWRQAHAPTVRFWYDCQRAFVRAAVDGRPSWVGPFEFTPGSDESVAVFLPSGRPLVYRDAEVWRDADERPRCVHYGQLPNGSWGTVHTYGGKLVENLIQAFCRDLMADALVRAERDGLCPVMTAHDEIVCEVDARAGQEGLDELHSIMVTLPDWAAGFPVGAAGFHGKRYRK